MALTRANIEAVLVRRCGRLLTAAGLDSTTISGANADLNDPIGWAIRQCAGTVASLVLVADTDIATVAESDLDKLLDLAELRTLESIQENNDLVDIQSDDQRKAWAALGTRLELIIARKRASVARIYGTLQGTLTAGTINLSFQQQNDE